jgi:hypothetical protein
MRSVHDTFRHYVLLNIKRTVWLTAVALIALNLSGCARKQATPLSQLSIYHQTAVSGSTPLGKDSVRTLTPFQELIVSLISDSLDLIPGESSSKIFEVILNGIAIPDQDDVIDNAVLFSQKKEDVALAAGLMVKLVYGGNVGHIITIPQSVLFSYKEKTTLADFTLAGAKLSSSENRRLDAYNACLNLLVNTMASNYGIPKKPKSGLYLRDSMSNLYFHKEIKM